MLNYICHFVCSDTGHQSPPFFFYFLASTPPPHHLLFFPFSSAAGDEGLRGRVGRRRERERGGGDIKNSLRLVAHQRGRDMTPEEEKGGVDNDEEYQT